MLFSAYKSLTVILKPFIYLYLWKRRRDGKEHTVRWRERMGQASLPRPQGHVLWCHAASVGEAISVLPLLHTYMAAFPERFVLLTTGTVTSAETVAKRVQNPQVLHQFVPVDQQGWVQSFLKHWSPDAVVWLESELWPNLLLQAQKQGIPTLLVNGRLSDNSYQRWQRWPKHAAKLLRSFTQILAQSHLDAERFANLCDVPVSCPGNLKYDAAPLPYDAAALKVLQQQMAGRRCWLAASTHPGEEVLIAEAHQILVKTYPDLLTTIVPRHPHRGSDIQAAMPDGLNSVLRSRMAAIEPTTAVYIADTLGELGLFYRLNTIVFMGGSLVLHGGQNMLEPALLDCALLTGSHTFNFRSIMAEMQQAGAVCVVTDAASLAAGVGNLLKNEELLQQMQAHAKQVASSQQGAVDRTLAVLISMLS